MILFILLVSINNCFKTDIKNEDQGIKRDLHHSIVNIQIYIDHFFLEFLIQKHTFKHKKWHIYLNTDARIQSDRDKPNLHHIFS